MYERVWLWSGSTSRHGNPLHIINIMIHMTRMPCASIMKRYAECCRELRRRCKENHEKLSVGALVVQAVDTHGAARESLAEDNHVGLGVVPPRGELLARPTAPSLNLILKRECTSRQQGGLDYAARLHQCRNFARKSFRGFVREAAP